MKYNNKNFNDISFFNNKIKDELSNAISDVITNGTYILGDHVTMFEKNFVF